MNNKEEPTHEVGKRPSWPYPSILFLYLVIFLLTPHIGEIAGLILFFSLMSASLWGALSPGQYQKIIQRYPTLPRRDYVINMLLFPVLVPLLIFVSLIVFNTNG